MSFLPFTSIYTSFWIVIHKIQLICTGCSGSFHITRFKTIYKNQYRLVMCTTSMELISASFGANRPKLAET